MEMMDLTDKQLKPCKCGYEVNIHGSSTILIWKQFLSFSFFLLAFILYIWMFLIPSDC
jgi:hypothetical protein